MTPIWLNIAHSDLILVLYTYAKSLSSVRNLVKKMFRSINPAFSYKMYTRCDVGIRKRVGLVEYAKGLVPTNISFVKQPQISSLYLLLNWSQLLILGHKWGLSWSTPPWSTSPYNDPSHHDVDFMIHHTMIWNLMTHPPNHDVTHPTHPIMMWNLMTHPPHHDVTHPTMMWISWPTTPWCGISWPTHPMMWPTHPTMMWNLITHPPTMMWPTPPTPPWCEFHDPPTPPNPTIM